MSKTFQIVLRWLPALLVMLMIFWFSAQPSSELPSFDWADRIVKKGGHMVGYALLAISYWQASRFRQGRQWIAWGFTLLYAVTDEFHQSFVPGRNASIRDILIFDNLGALISLWLLTIVKAGRSDATHPIAKEINAKS